MTLGVSHTRSCQFGPIVVQFDERVLTPRAWTWEQASWAAEIAADAGEGRILELCAGAGHIGLAAAVLSGRDLVQVEADPIAADYARSNATRAGWAGRAQVRCGPLQDQTFGDETFPIIIADPPYLRSEDIGLWPDDPPAAIDGGSDGMHVVHACLAVAARQLGAQGHLLLQVAGTAQDEQVSAVLAAEHTLRLRRVASRVIDTERSIMLITRTV